MYPWLLILYGMKATMMIPSQWEDNNGKQDYKVYRTRSTMSTERWVSIVIMSGSKLRHSLYLYVVLVFPPVSNNYIYCPIFYQTLSSGISKSHVSQMVITHRMYSTC